MSERAWELTFTVVADDLLRAAEIHESLAAQLGKMNVPFHVGSIGPSSVDIIEGLAEKLAAPERVGGE